MIPQGASGLAFAHRAKRLCLICGLLGLLAPSGLLADWRAAQEASVLNGVQAVLMCNGLFTSGRSLTQVYDQELKYLSPPRFRSALGDASGGPYRVDQANRSVIVGTDNPEQQVAAVYQPGFGCIVLAPGELPTAEVVAELPVYPAIGSASSNNPYPTVPIAVPTMVHTNPTAAAPPGISPKSQKRK